MGRLFYFVTVNPTIFSTEHLLFLFVFISQSMMESGVHSLYIQFATTKYHEFHLVMCYLQTNYSKVLRFCSETNIDAIRKSIKSFELFYDAGSYYSTTSFNKTFSQNLHRFEYWLPRVKYLRWWKPWKMVPSGNNGQCHTPSIFQQNNLPFIDILEWEAFCYY